MALIICDVFEQELALVMPGASHVVEQRLFEIGLHDRPDVMRVELQQALDALAAREDIAVIALLYGLCGCGTVGLHSARQRLVIPRAHDCRTVFLGSKELFAEREQACPGCYYYTPGWNRARRVPGPERDALLRADFARQFDPDDVEFLLESDREMWASYNTAAYIDHDTPNTAAEAAYTRTCAESLGWRYEHLKGDLTLLHDLIWGPWDADRFQVIEPGQRLAHSPDAAIMRAEPHTPQP
jgi:hypothetical protein